MNEELPISNTNNSEMWEFYRNSGSEKVMGDMTDEELIEEYIDMYKNKTHRVSIIAMEIVLKGRGLLEKVKAEHAEYFI